MRSAHGDKYTGFANFETAETMGDDDTMDAVLFVELYCDFAHFGEGHGLVGFVVEVKRRAIVRLIADEAIEGDDSPVFGSANPADEGSRIDRLANQLKNIVVIEGRGHGLNLATADRRKKCDFVTRMKQGVPGGKFLITRGHDRRAVFGEFRDARGIEGKELFDGGGFCKVEGILSVANDIFQAAKEKHFHADALGESRHERIVARARGGMRAPDGRFRGFGIAKHSERFGRLTAGPCLRSVQEGTAIPSGEIRGRRMR